LLRAMLACLKGHSFPTLRADQKKKTADAETSKTCASLCSRALACLRGPLHGAVQAPSKRPGTGKGRVSAPQHTMHQPQIECWADCRSS
jgi:hypothetical protein